MGFLREYLFQENSSFALRASATTMRFMCQVMAMSTTTTAGILMIPTGLTISFVYHLYEKYNQVFRQSHLYYGGTYYD